MPLLICPNCNVAMTQVKRSEVEIDMCPQCRGIWLDRGELEKLLQPLREETAAYETRQAPRSNYQEDDHDHSGRDRRDENGYGRKKNRGLLDFFD